MKYHLVYLTGVYAGLVTAQITAVPSNQPVVCFGAGGACNNLLNADLNCLALTGSAAQATCACGAINLYAPSVSTQKHHKTDVVYPVL
jgi:hypothetical protein